MASRMSEKQRRDREKAAEARRLAYKTPEWTSSRPKPRFDPTIWPDPETVDVLAEYTDFHGRNPHMVTPRPLDDVLVVAGKDLKLALPREQLKAYTTEEDKESIEETGLPAKKGAQLVYYSAGVKVDEVPEHFNTPTLGMHGTMARVASVSNEFERKAANAGRYTNEDKWYKMSVKDMLETYHIDGDHTSVVLKPPKPRPKSKAQLEFEAEAKWREEQYGRYQGGAPATTMEQMKILESLSISVPASKEDKKIVSPWEDQYKWTDYNASGTLLDDFNKVDLERKLKFALEAHEELLEADIRRKAEARAARIREKKKALGIATPTPPNSKPGTAGLGTGGMLGRAQIHPMDSVPEDGLPEGAYVDGDVIVQDLDDVSMFDGAGSVSSMGGMTYQQDMGSVAGEAGSLDGDSSQVTGGDTAVGAGSLTSGSTYRNRKHGDDISQLDMATGASQSSVPESTLEEALQFANNYPGGGGGGSVVSREKDDMSQISGFGAESVDGGVGSLSKKSKRSSVEDSVGGDTADDSAIVTEEPKKKSKRQSKLDGILASKGLKLPDTASSSGSGSGSSTKKSLSSKIFGAPGRALMWMLGRRRSTSGDGDEDDPSLEQQRKLRDSEIVLSDDEEEEKVDEDVLLDKYDLMKKKLGGDEVLEKQAEAWMKFAAVVRKSSKRDTNMFDSSMDLPDAIEKNNLAKVVFLLAVGQNDPNMRANNDEPVLINLVMKILVQDTLTGSTEDDKNESPDRVKMFRVLQALVKFGVNLNTTEAKNGIPPLHLAVNAGNMRMIDYLIESGADFNLLSDPPAGDVVGASPLMHAAKFGYIYIMARLIRLGSNMHTADEQGRNALHYCALFGQTRAAMFLLRSGHDKRIKDNFKQTAGLLAEDLGFTVCGQAIMTYAILPYKAQFALEYFNSEEERKKAPKDVLSNAANLAGNAAGKAAAAFGAAKDAGMNALKNLGTYLLQLIGLGPPKVEKINADDAFDMEAGNGEDNDGDGGD